jgi:hypothetical protein
VKFGNTRYQHKEAAARFLLIEDSLKATNNIVDTKKVYLDDLARRYRNDRKKVGELKDAVTKVLTAMHGEFTERDELLQAQGILVVYYLLFSAALESGNLDKITRRKLLNFRQRLAQNREEAAANYAEASFELLEFDRMNQQGTNDASNIKERYRILSNALRIPAAKFDGVVEQGEE